MPANDDTSEAPVSQQPSWTTGQGIGFLVMLPGLIVIVAAVVAMLVTVWAVTDDDDMLTALAACAGVLTLGLLAAVPGMIVFFKCRRPQ